MHDAIRPTVTRIVSAGFSRREFSVKMNFRREIDPTLQRKKTVYLPGARIRFTCTPEEFRQRIPNLLLAGFDLIFTFDPESSDEQVSTFPTLIEAESGEGRILFRTKKGVELPSSLRIRALGPKEAGIISVNSSLEQAGDVILEQLSSNPGRLPYLQSWLFNGCQIRIVPDNSY